MCSNCDSGQYDRELAHIAARKKEAEQEPLEDAAGTDVLQAYLAAAYAAYIHQSTRNLMGFVYKSSPLVGVHRL